MRFISLVGISLSLLIGFSQEAHARHRHYRIVAAPPAYSFFGGPIQYYTPQQPVRQVVRTRYVHRSYHRHALRASEASIGRIIPNAVNHTQIIDHPSGCPRTAFCGCGAAVRIFGAPLRALWAAASWFKFPRASPAPGMVAVRRHHVFVLEGKLDNGLWLAYDANSGGHQTRIHARSLAGYTIVNPHGHG